MRRSYLLLIPVATLAVVLPLLAHGCSCGHDFSFHLLSWLEAANQFRHGALYPHWVFAAAYNAGEPRFVFYPPLSWMLGALITLALPFSLVPAAYTAFAVTACGFTMYRLARQFAAPHAAAIAATLYVVNPYMLFTAYERTAYAELLASAWLPLLFLAALRRRPTIHGVAMPVALLWLTNAPAAVMGCYALAGIIAIRLMQTGRSSANTGDPHPSHRTLALESPMKLLLTSVSGTALGLALAAVYLVPAAYERRFVQIAMAIIPNMRFEDNFLFGHTDDAPHNAVLHTASLISLELLAYTAAALAATYFLHTRKRTVILGEARRLQPKEPGTLGLTNNSYAARALSPLPVLSTLTASITFLLTPLSAPVWRHLPELAFLQFPWRFLSVLAVCLSLATALVLTRLSKERPVRDAAPRRREQARTLLIGTAILVILIPASIHVFRQPCEAEDIPTAQAQAFRDHTGVLPTDEYTPTNADNDVLRADDPPLWFTTDPAAFAPGTTPNPAATGSPSTSAEPGAASSVPATRTAGALRANALTKMPLDFTVSAPSAGFVILNLRNYPRWNVRLDDPDSIHQPQTPSFQRDDGLVAVQVYHRGTYRVHIAWRRGNDEWLGDLLSLLAFVILVTLLLRSRSRRIEAQTQ